MTQVAFSHQFSHRWANAPLQVKGALIQELDDIVQLLDNQTDLEQFEFSIPDLHEYIDTIYAEIAAEQEAARQEASRLEAEQLAADREAIQAADAQDVIEPQTLSYDDQDEPTDSADDTAADATSLKPDADIDNAQQAATEHLTDETDTPAIEEADANQPTTDSAEAKSTKLEAQADSPLEAKTVETESDDQLQAETAVQAEATVPAPSQPEAFEFDNTQGQLTEDFIKELEARIDDYLSEQLANMSEDLKAWLRDQVKERLNNKQS